MSIGKWLLKNFENTDVDKQQALYEKSVEKNKQLETQVVKQREKLSSLQTKLNKLKEKLSSLKSKVEENNALKKTVKEHLTKIENLNLQKADFEDKLNNSINENKKLQENLFSQDQCIKQK